MAKAITIALRYVDPDGKRRFESLCHSDRRKAEKQRAKKEKELRMGFCDPGSMRLSEFIQDSLKQTGGHIRPSTKTEYLQAMEHFIRIIGDIDFQSINQKHGEKFRQACLDEGNSKDTVAKKVRQLKAVFNLAKERNQLEENPLQFLKPPKVPKNRKIHTYSEDQCSRILKAASEIQKESVLEWDLVITLAITTGMRKSELLNMVWSDVDFGDMNITVTPKENTDETWEWLIKDTDSRTLPLTEDVSQLLINLQDKRPENYPYVLVPPNRYDHIQELRKQGKWEYASSRIKVVNNFTRQFKEIKTRAGIKIGTFHDLRRTAITNWFYAGLEITEVMRLAGHSKYETCLRYYLAVKDDLVDRARRAVKHRVSREMLDRCLGRGE